MGSISVGDTTLHMYKGHFNWRNNRASPSSFRTMGSRRRSRGSRRASSSSFLPVLVLDNENQYGRSQVDRVGMYDGRGARHLPGQDRMGDISSSGSDMYGAYSGGCGCGGGGDSATLPVIIAALAAATFFLYQAILMAGKRRRKRRDLGEQGGERQEDIEHFILKGMCYFIS